MTVARLRLTSYTAPMKHIAALLFLVGLYSNSALAQNTPTEELALEIMTPYAKQMGLKGINLTRSEEFSDNLGSSEIRNGYI